MSIEKEEEIKVILLEIQIIVGLITRKEETNIKISVNYKNCCGIFPIYIYQLYYTSSSGSIKIYIEYAANLY